MNLELESDKNPLQGAMAAGRHGDLSSRLRVHILNRKYKAESTLEVV